MMQLRRLFARQEPAEYPYSTEVLCSGWIASPAGQSVPRGQAAVRESLREADAPTILARIYTSQNC